MVTIFIPVLLLGAGNTADFWKAVWPMGILVVLALGGMNMYFVLNRRMINYLEKEDWPALSEYLEKKIFQEGRYSRRNVRLLSQSYLVLGNFEAVLRLESKVTELKPDLAAENVLLFTSARLLDNTAENAPNKAVEYLKSCLENKNAADVYSGDMEWIRWYYGFSMIRVKTPGKSFIDDALAIFGDLALNAKDIPVAGLSVYFICQTMGKNFCAGDNLYDAAETGKARVQKKVKTIKRWQRKVDKLTSEVHGIIIKTYLNETGLWLFPAGK